MSTVCTRSKRSLATRKNPFAERSGVTNSASKMLAKTKPCSSTPERAEASSRSSVTIATSRSSNSSSGSSGSSSSTDGEGGGIMWEEEEEEVSCTTPRARESRIPEFCFCPPAPRKRKPHFTVARASFHPSSHFLPVLDFDSIFS